MQAERDGALRGLVKRAGGYLGSVPGRVAGAVRSAPKKLGAFFRAPIKSISGAFDRHPVTATVILAFLLTEFIEMVARRSPWDGIVFIFAHPVSFFTNMCIIMMTLSTAHFFKKRPFYLSLISSVWIALGIVDAVVESFRGIPFGLIDIKVLPSVLPILNMYLDVWQIVLVCVAAVLVLAALVLLYIKSGKRKPRYNVAAIFMAASVLLAAGSYSLTVMGREEKRQEDFSNITVAYRKYGFTYCFCTGAVDQGIHQPGFYSRAAVNWLVGNLDEEETPEVLPNIIMVQLESFFDISHLDDVDYVEDPIPTFTAMKERCSSGFLTVPSVGAGTANTEFEVLSGMSLDFFGIGEYPYKTILKEEACETVVRDLAELGYTGTAVHNNMGTFYSRDEVFAQLGFDRFIPIEFMDGVEYNPIGWARDAVLTDEILKAMDTSAGLDFVFTITVQGHGKYQRGVDSVDMEYTDVEWANEEEEDDAAFAYYVSQLSETDRFIADLTAALSRRAEPTVVVFYGDHLPSFSIGSDQLENGDIFQTEYVIWSNYELPEHDENLNAYQLTAKVLKELGISRGLLTRYHQQMAGSQDYLDGLKLLEYDMLYGDFYCYGGSNPYEATDLQMGVEPIVARHYSYDVASKELTVYGENFTPFSAVTLDGQEAPTEFINSGTLKATLEDPPFFGQVLTVRQVTKRGVTLYESVGLVLK